MSERSEKWKVESAKEVESTLHFTLYTLHLKRFRHHVLTFPAAPGIRNGSTTLP
jgi:hypothetical protein